MRQFRSNSLDIRHRPWSAGSRPISPSALSFSAFGEKVEDEGEGAGNSDVPFQRAGLPSDPDSIKVLLDLNKITRTETFIPSVGMHHLTRSERPASLVP